jgi:hypothetical protein
MPTTFQEIELQVVIQFGGTSKEQYLHTFSNETAAKKFIRSAERASYRCLGPFPLLLPGLARLSKAAADVIEWIEFKQLKDTGPAFNLTRALAVVREEFPLG